MLWVHWWRYGRSLSYTRVSVDLCRSAISFSLAAGESLRKLILLSIGLMQNQEARQCLPAEVREVRNLSLHWAI